MYNMLIPHPWSLNLIRRKPNLHSRMKMKSFPWRWPIKSHFHGSLKYPFMSGQNSIHSKPGLLKLIRCVNQSIDRSIIQTFFSVECNFQFGLPSLFVRHAPREWLSIKTTLLPLLKCHIQWPEALLWELASTILFHHSSRPPKGTHIGEFLGLHSFTEGVLRKSCWSWFCSNAINCLHSYWITELTSVTFFRFLIYQRATKDFNLLWLHLLLLHLCGWKPKEFKGISPTMDFCSDIRMEKRWLWISFLTVMKVLMSMTSVRN